MLSNFILAGRRIQHERDVPVAFLGGLDDGERRRERQGEELHRERME